MSKSLVYDVIVIGGGHAGCEAALAAARCGAETLLVTHSLETLGQMSCNPAIGGVGKSQLVAEIDSLGGMMAIAGDRAGIHFRTLNMSKGPAVRATRAQTDRQIYRKVVRCLLEEEQALYFLQEKVDDLLIKNQRLQGVVTSLGLHIHAPAVVLTAGTFLAGRIHVGKSQDAGGRAGAPASNRLAARLRELNTGTRRMKTGTPPRIDGRSVDFSGLEVQKSEYPSPALSFLGSGADHPRQVPCHLTRTNETTHAIVRDALKQSPLYSGAIRAPGPRYCPSIEDKVVRFAERDWHRVFIEPEGLATQAVYPNGISTSLPYHVQIAMVRSIKGFEKARITAPGYAIEYDCFDPRKLHMSFETQEISGLFFAGQINGTTGYEEAAAQGLLAGLNAARSSFGKEPWWPLRSEAAMGVLLDDLTMRGITEPYRMFSSRMEYRLSLREDNADLRLTPQGRKLGLVDDRRWRVFVEKREAIEREQARLRASCFNPAVIKKNLLAGSDRAVPAVCTGESLLAQPGVRYADVAKQAGFSDPEQNLQVVKQLEIQALYAGHIKRQAREIEKLKAREKQRIRADFDFAKVSGLSNEVRDKLVRFRPRTIGQASRLEGVTPVCMSLLLAHMKHEEQARERPPE